MYGVGWCRGVEGEFAVSMRLYACLGARRAYLYIGCFVLLLRHGGIGCLTVNLFEFVKCECDAVLFGGQVDNSIFVEGVSMLQFRVHSEQMCQPFFGGTTAKKSGNEEIDNETAHKKLQIKRAYALSKYYFITFSFGKCGGWRLGF